MLVKFQWERRNAGLMRVAFEWTQSSFLHTHTKNNNKNNSFNLTNSVLKCSQDNWLLNLIQLSGKMLYIARQKRAGKRCSLHSWLMAYLLQLNFDLCVTVDSSEQEIQWPNSDKCNPLTIDKVSMELVSGVICGLLQRCRCLVIKTGWWRSIQRNGGFRETLEHSPLPNETNFIMKKCCINGRIGCRRMAGGRGRAVTQYGWDRVTFRGICRMDGSVLIIIDC